MPVGALFRHWSVRLLAPERAMQQTYDAFRALLGFDLKSHELMAEFETLLHEKQQEDLARTRSRYHRFAESIAAMVTALEQMCPGEARTLREYFSKYDFYCRLQLAPPEQFLIPPFAVAHDDPVEPGLVGNKSANLLRIKHAALVTIPEGFTITTTTFGLLVAHNGLRPAMDLLLASIDLNSTTRLNEVSQALMTLVRRMVIPDRVEQAIYAEYDWLAARIGRAPTVAVRSSALHEDDVHSFAGQYHTVLGVDRAGLLTAYLEVLASKYSPQALVYRIQAGLGDEETAMAVLVLELVEGVASGIVYTRDPANLDNADLLVHAIHGLGLPLVGGEIVPDVFVVPSDSELPQKMVSGSQQRQLVWCDNRLREQECGDGLHTHPPLNQEQVREIAAVARRLEHLFGVPQDIEWVLDREQRLSVVQARPLLLERLAVTRKTTQVALEDVRLPLPLLSVARRASGGTVHGIVQHFDMENPQQLAEGSVLVTRQIPPSLVRHITKLAAVICEQGAVTGHFATVCREFGVVLLVEANGALARLPPGLEVTVDGFAGAVYPGKVAELLALDSKKSDDSVSMRRLRNLLGYITPLHLLDPSSLDFRPQSCRSLHDIIRYAHEKAVQTMFGLGTIAGGASARCRKLATHLPLDLYLLDVGGAFTVAGGETVGPETLASVPFCSLWLGLSDPGIDWTSHRHFDWKGFGDMALSGGIAMGAAKEFASYAVIGADYLNLNLRFGYHFTLIDCLCGAESRTNYCQLRFAGGGGEYQGRLARIGLLRSILSRLSFEVTVRGDLLNARLFGASAESLKAILVDVGRLFGLTKLLDMTLCEEEIADRVEDFFHGAIDGIGPISLNRH